MAEVGNKEDQISRLYSVLQRTIGDEDDEAILSAAQKILDVSYEEEEAATCKLVALIHLSKFSAALSFIRGRVKKSSGASLYQFEEAYCLYRQEKYEESWTILSRMSQSDARVSELQAQIAYKREEYNKAHSIYKKLVEESSSPSAELNTNYYATACLTSSTLPACELKTCAENAMEGHNADTMEQCFNLACAQLVSGRGDLALQLLGVAEKLHRKTLEEDEYSEEEIEEEMALLLLLRGYILQVQSKPKEALSCYNSVLKTRPDDSALLAVVANNILVVNGDRDVFDSRKRMKVLVSEGGSKKLTSHQRATMLFNRSIFALQTNQLDQCRDLVHQLRQMQPTDYPLAVLAEAALLYRERKQASAVQLLQGFVDTSDPGRLAVDVQATLAQLLLYQGDTSKACATLKMLPDCFNHVGVASALAQLYSGLGCMEEAMEVLQQMLQAWLQRHGNDTELQQMTSDLVAKVAKFQLVHHRSEQAALTLDKLKKTRQLDLRGIALLIGAYSQFNPQKAEELRGELPSFKSGKQVDVEALEQAPMFRHSRGTTTRTNTQATTVTEMTKEKKKRKRKPHLPKNYDPSSPPDSERWLPLKERSYYRRSRRKGVSATARGSQGIGAASAALMNQLDASKPSKTEATEVGSGEGATNASSSPKVAHKPSSQQAKKKPKKKKGNKW